MPEESGHSGGQRPHAAKPLDARDPYVVDTRELGRRAGSMRTASRTVPATANLGLPGTLTVPDGASLQLEFRLESVVDGVLVTGTAQADLVGECARCLDPVEFDLDVDYQELYLYPDEETEDEDAMWLSGDLIDLEPVVHDAVVLALPQQPLCRDDCPGLCVECGARLADDPGHRHEHVDQRWAALERLRSRTGAHDEVQ